MAQEASLRSGRATFSGKAKQHFGSNSKCFAEVFNAFAKSRFFTHKLFFIILNGIGEVWGCPGGGGGPYEDIVSNFGRVWSYRTWGKSIFMFFGNIGNSLHHQINTSKLVLGPPDGSLDLS